MEENWLNYIITYQGSKDEFQANYLDTLNEFGCSINDYIENEGLTVVMMQYGGRQPEKLEEKLGALNNGKLYVERDAVRNWLPEGRNPIYDTKKEE